MMHRRHDGTGEMERRVMNPTTEFPAAEAVLHDITTRRQSEHALSTNAARLQTLFEYSPYAIWDEDFSAVRAHFAALLQSFAKKSTGSSTRIARAILLDAGPSIDKSEMTDKGSINQRAVLGNRAHLVDMLYAAEAPPAVLSAG
jgi:hypothetical protein